MEFFEMPDKIIEEMKINSALRYRKIYLNEGIENNSIFKAIYFLDRLVELDKKNGNEKPDIFIVVNSYGGIILEGLGLISRIESLKEDGYKIITIVPNYAMSMGSAISIVASERWAYKHARFLFHQPSSATWGKLQDMQEDVQDTLELWDRMKSIIIKYTKITDEQLEDIKSRKVDWQFWSDKALELGVIDKII